MHITMVKKIKHDGSPCRKCAEVEQRLQESGLLNRIDQILIADERDPQSEGMLLAKQHQVELAPFFIVEDEDGSVRIYTVYFRFIKEVLNSQTSAQEEAAEILDNNPDVDFI